MAVPVILGLKPFRSFLLRYDEIVAGVTCLVCKRHHSKLKKNVEKSFTVAVYLDWKHAPSSFDEHQVASYRRLAD